MKSFTGQGMGEQVPKRHVFTIKKAKKPSVLKRKILKVTETLFIETFGIKPLSILFIDRRDIDYFKIHRSTWKSLYLESHQTVMSLMTHRALMRPQLSFTGSPKVLIWMMRMKLVR